MNKTSIILSALLLTALIGYISYTKNIKIIAPGQGNIRGCDNFDGQNACQGSQTDNAADWANRNFQTPPRGDPHWRESYQDYHLLQGYAQWKYDTGMNSVTIHIITRVNPKVSKSASLVYNVDGVDQSSNTLRYDTSKKSIVHVIVKLVEGSSTIATLKLEPIDFHWNHPTVNQGPEYKNGQKGAIVEMFGWPYDDIALECEMLGKAGYMGVKVYPPSESVLDFEHPENGELNPWYWMYQPVSYKLKSRMGTPEQLRSMINKCRQFNVRVYADAVVNHMAGNGNDMFPTHCSGNVNWGNKNSSGGSPFWSQGFAFENWYVTGNRPGMEFPGVPYGPNDFHCARSLNSWTDGFIMNYGWLVNLSDLNTETEYVRQRIADYITELISLGISGVRIDAAKHISPDNLAAIFARLKANLGGSLTPDFSAYLEVIIGGERDLLMCNDNSYNYGQYFERAMRNAGLSNDDIYKIKIWSSDYPKEHPICGWWPIPSERLVIQLDCHDDQNQGSSSRDMGDKGTVLVKAKDVNLHRQFSKDLFYRTDANWQIRLVMSSYSFMNSGAQGPPDGHSDCTKCTGNACGSCNKSVPFQKAHNPNVCGYTCVENGSWQEGRYTRVHRDKQIIDAMRHWMGIGQKSAVEYGLPGNCN